MHNAVMTVNTIKRTTTNDASLKALSERILAFCLSIGTSDWICLLFFSMCFSWLNVLKCLGILLRNWIAVAEMNDGILELFLSLNVGAKFFL